MDNTIMDLEKDLNELEYELGVDLVTWFKTIAVYMLYKKYPKKDIVEYIKAVVNTDGVLNIHKGDFKESVNAKTTDFIKILKFVSDKTKYNLSPVQVIVPNETFCVFQKDDMFAFGYMLDNDIIYTGNANPYFVKTTNVKTLHMFKLEKDKV